MANIRHASAVKPISIPNKADVDTDNWDRVNSFSVSTTQPQEDLYEIGRLSKTATDKDTFETTLSITQLEYGTNASFLQVAGVSAEPSGGFELSDFDDARLDFYLPGKTEYGGTLEQTLWLEKLALESFSLSINAEERLERSFEFSGEYAKILANSNKNLIFKEDTAPSGTSGTYDIDLSDPAPVEDPNNSGSYILKIWRVRSGTATELTSSDYSYASGTTTLTITSASASDHYRIFYSSGSYGTSGDPTALNDADDYFLGAENVTVTIDDGTNSAVELDKLTSLTIDATLNRIDEAVIGSDEKVLKDVEDYDVSYSFDGYVKNSPIEEALMTQAGQSYGIIDFTLFNTVTVVVKVYETKNKNSFLIGYKTTGLEFADESQDWTANEFSSNPISLNSDNLVITTTEEDL